MTASPAVKTVVLDDDPTGTQSARDVTVILDWDVDLLDQTLRDEDSVYVLTNTRALPEAEAVALLRTIRDETSALAERRGFIPQFVLRGDSTLRGHVFAETEVFADPDSIRVFLPAFPAGGRITREGVHYVTVDGQLVRAEATEYAHDPVFPFNTGDLAEYVRSGGWVPVQHDLRTLREGAPSLARRLAALPPGSTALFDAENDSDIRVVADAIVLARAGGRRIVVRCASPLAAQLAGVESHGLLEAGDVDADERPTTLVVCGSHTSGATAQLRALEGGYGAAAVIETNAAMTAPAAAGQRVARTVSASLRSAGFAAVSSERVRHPDDNTLEHGARVMTALTTVVSAVAGEISLLVAKGGITSADVARVGLGARTARVAGQILPGVSLWQLRERGGHAVSYVVVPGNVGDTDVIVDALGIMGVPPAR